MGRMEDIMSKLSSLVGGGDDKAKALLDDLEATLHKHWDELEEIAKDAKLAEMVREALTKAGAPKSALDKDLDKIVKEALHEVVDSVGGREKSSFVEFLSHPHFSDFMKEFADFNAAIKKKL